MSAGVCSLIIAVDGSALGLAFLGLLSGHGHSQFGSTKVYTNSYNWESTLIKTYPRRPLLFFTLPVFHHPAQHYTDHWEGGQDCYNSNWLRLIVLGGINALS